MKKLLQVAVLLSLATCLRAQGLRYDNIALTTKNTAYGEAMVPVAGATISVCSQPANVNSVPCTPLVQLYADSGLMQQIANPTNADAKGNYHFYYDPNDGPLTVMISGAGVQTFVMPDQNGIVAFTAQLHGSGTPNNVTKWTGTQNLGNSLATDDGTNYRINENLIANPIISTNSPPASTGVIRLANNVDKICWRNSTNTADICIFVDNSNNFNIQGNTLITGNLTVTGTINGGGGGGGGTVLSVAMNGDGVVYNTTVPGSPITSSGTLAPVLANAPSNFFLAGPIGAAGSNVAFRQLQTCTSSGTSMTCTFPSPVQNGSIIVIKGGPSTGGGSFFWATDTDSLGTTFSDTGGSSSARVGVGKTVASGNDTITVSGGNVGSGGSLLIVELTGANAFNTSNYQWTSGNDNTATVPFSLTNTLSPSASTDAELNFFSTNGTCYPSTGMGISPASAFLGYFNPPSGAATGAVWLSSTGSTASQNFTATSTVHSGSCHNAFEFMTMDFTQSVTAGSSPWTARRITESDLPASAISALQSVNEYDLPADVALTSNTTTNIITQTITMPSDGCPCRVAVDWGEYVWWSGSGPRSMVSWITDGAANFASSENGTAGNSTGGVSGSGMSPPYTNNQSITITLKSNVLGPTSSGAASVTKLPAVCSPADCTSLTTWSGVSTQPTHMTLSVMQSRN